ncbi:hypothetical protein GCM10020366_04170 [Saccharopolyspora gregorii]|uniref:Uncharacterized protein n=1 Tax=Saccharopolyspora gregorii TaxID=33914 RepID=A0ABP6RHG3_9PSEU
MQQQRPGTEVGGGGSGRGAERVREVVRRPLGHTRSSCGAAITGARWSGGCCARSVVLLAEHLGSGLVLGREIGERAILHFVAAQQSRKFLESQRIHPSPTEASF